MDYSEMIINEHLIATISTGEIVGVQYKIDDGEWQNYSEQLYITEDCTIYARLTDGTTVYKQVEQEILMPIACTQIGNAATYHTTVQNAINIAGTNPGATVTLLKGEIAETVTVAAGQDMVIDLNGKTWANIGEQTITNNGEGLITSSSSYTIINNGTFEKYGNSTIEYTGTVYYALRNSGTANLFEGMIKSSVIGVENKENGKVLVDGITLQSTDYTIRNNIATEVIETLDNPSIIIKSGLIESTDDAAVACFYNRTIDIQGGTIKGNKGVEIAGSGILNISNTTIEGVEYGIINNYGQVFVNEGCVIIGNNKYGITNVRNATTTVTGGIIKGNLAGIQSQEIEGLVVTTTITGGIISGNTDGVIQSQEDILVIGIDDKVVSQNTPVIIGNDVRIVTGSGTFEFYDGIIKGADKKSKSGVVTKILDGYYIEKGTETIEAVEYETSYLAPKNYEEVTFTGTHVNYYATLVDAIANVTSGNTIKPLKNMEETTSGEIIDEKTVIFDLNGYTITNPNGPVLKTNGELTITGEGTINGSADTILNEGTKTLTILSGEIF